MLSEQHLVANLEALARAGTPAPPLGRVDPEELRLVERQGEVALAIRASDGGWVVLDDDGTSVQKVTAETPRTICVIGTRVGLTIDAVAARRPQAQIIAFEPDPAHALILLSRRNWSRAIASGELVLLIGPDYPGASSSARRFDGASTPPVITDPLLATHRSAATRAAGAKLGQMIGEARANHEARRAFAPRYLTQTLQNLPAIAREADASALDASFAGVPALIVGAGPSLDDTAGALAEVSDRCVIIAADTAMAPLEQAAITPHIVVAVDPSEWNARHLAAPARVGQTWLVAEGSLYPAAFDRFAGRTFTFEVSGHEPWPWLAGHGLSRGRLRAWGSVVTSAFDLAVRMGCSPIVFAGLDLAFSKGHTYCRHTAHEEIWGKWIEAGDTWDNVWAFLVSQQPQQTFADLHGRSTISSPYLIAFRNWLVEQIAAAPAHHTFVNVSGAGLLYGPRIEQATVREALGGQPAIARASLEDRLTAAHTASCRIYSSLPAAMREAARQLGSAVPSALEARWRQFTVDGIDAARVSDILLTASQGLAS